MAKKKSGAATPPETSAVDLAIEGFRAAHRVWDRAIPRVGVHIGALDANGNGFTIDYHLPDGKFGDTAEERRRFGFAKPDWSSMLQPILPPTDEEWRAKYEACAAARIILAEAAERLAIAIEGADDSSRHLRAGAQRLARLLRDVPPVWPTKVETDLAFEINNGRIGDYRQSVNEARRRREAAEKEAQEERRKEKAEKMADALIAWHEAQKQRANDPRSRSVGRAARKKTERGDPRDNDANDQRKAADRAWILRLNQKHRGKGRLKLSKLAQLTATDAANEGRQTGLSRDTVRRRVRELIEEGEDPKTLPYVNSEPG